jgi:hypothetical protein
MRFAFSFSSTWRPLFALFGFRPGSSVVELGPDALHFRFGTAFESVPFDQIAGVSRRRWPFYYGLGAKLGPDGGVSWVASSEGVVRVDFVSPRPLNVWGPFRRADARCVIVSLEDPDGFIVALEAARHAA